MQCNANAVYSFMYMTASESGVTSYTAMPLRRYRCRVATVTHRRLAGLSPLLTIDNKQRPPSSCCASATTFLYCVAVPKTPNMHPAGVVCCASRACKGPYNRGAHSAGGTSQGGFSAAVLPPSAEASSRSRVNAGERRLVCDSRVRRGCIV